MTTARPGPPIASRPEVFVLQYREAAGDGPVLELKMRLLASRVPALQPFTDGRLEDVEGEIVRLFAGYLTEDQREELRLCRQHRNKVLHCDFPKARKKLHELGAPQVRGGVRQIRLPDQSGPGILRSLTEGLSDDPATHEHVADLTSTAEAGVFGWLLELGRAEDFVRAADVFRAASSIIDRLFAAADELDE